jgi:hypothetical protein
MLSVINWHLMVSVVMLNAIMLSVVALLTFHMINKFDRSLEIFYRV